MMVEEQHVEGLREREDDFGGNIEWYIEAKSVPKLWFSER